ncbi:MAG: DUF1559 domain-containing protein [Pirellulaceae bacterium]|nr:DUF1559 domain-containing protein [Pirellulaceae bacterium]
MRKRRIHGFTLVELLVVIAIIGVLVALLLPAVQAAREAARRMHCSNNIKQMALAMHNYHAAHEILPAGSYNNGGSGCTALYGSHSWFEMLMPFMELKSVYDRIDFTHPTSYFKNAPVILDLYVPGGACPSDTFAGLLPHSRFKDSVCPEGTMIAGRFTDKSMGASYVPSAGPVRITSGCPIPAWVDGGNCQSDQMGLYDAGAPGMFAAGWVAYSWTDCTDGLSHTFLLGETLPARRIHAMYFTSSSHMATTNLPPNYWRINPRGCPEEFVPAKQGGIPGCHLDMAGFNSYHPGVVQMAMADASV